MMNSIGLVTFLNMASVVGSLFYSILVAYFFGTSRGVQVFFAASGLQISVLALSQSGQLSELFLPIYHRIREEAGKAHAFVAFSVIINWVVVLASLGVAALWFISGALAQLRVPGFSGDEINLCAQMFRAMVPALLLQVFCSFAVTVGNAERMFGRPETAGLAGRVISLLLVLLLAGSLGPWALVIAFWGNQIVTAVGLVLILRSLGLRHRSALSSPFLSPVEFVKGLSWSVSNTLFLQLWAFAFDAALSHVPGGGFAIFKYVNALAQKAKGVVLRPVGVVYFTDFSEAHVGGGTGMKRSLTSALSLVLAACTVVSAGIVGAGYETFRAMWRTFTDEELLVATLLAIGLFSLMVFAGIWQLYRKYLVAQGHLGLAYVCFSVSLILASAMVGVFVSRGGLWGALGAVALFNVLLVACPIIGWWLIRREVLPFLTVRQVSSWAISAVLGAGAARLTATLVIKAGVLSGGSVTADVLFSFVLWCVAVLTTVFLSALLKVPVSLAFIQRASQFCRHGG
jgi:putative peptidoglycan lipid II flippase